MNDFSIRITHRQGDTVRSIDIDAFPAAPPTLSLAPSQPAVAKRFTVTDGMTHDASTGLTWSADDVTEKGVSHKKADEACKALRLGGHDDWRLPTRAELLTLVEDTRHSPAIDTEAFPSCKSDWYWTSTTSASSSGYAWIVYFSSGSSGYGGRGSLSRVRAVRSSAGQ